jgi:parvulin-like peptidyl-prolyl isomerase
MNKKIIIGTIILSLFLGAGPIGILTGSYGVKVFAQEAELPNPGLTPDSPFYFLDTLGEKIGMFFAFSAEKKAEKALQYAEEKLAEVKAMAEQKEIKAMEKANQKYEKFLGFANQKIQDAKEKGRDVEELAALITEKTLKHREILSEIFEKVPEQAKKGIEKAIEVSKKGSETAVQSVTGAKKEELQQKIKTFDWQIFIDSKTGYSVKYPDGWRKKDFENGIGVGPQEIREDVLWGIWFYDSSQMSDDEIISKIGSQFELGRNVIRENIKFNNIQGLKVVATTSQFSDWYSESIIIEHGGKIFHIGNGAVKDHEFKLFYRSFKFIELKEAAKEVSKIEATESKEGLVAIVNGAEITEHEFIQRLGNYILTNESQLSGQSGLGQRADETEDEYVQRLKPLYGKSILEYMIIEIIIEQEAKEQNITVKPEEINEKIDKLKPKATAEQLSKMGITIEDLRQRFESEILIEKIVAKQVIVTEKEIRDYFESRKTNFAKPEEIRAFHILFSTEIEAEVILSQLKNGADFAELAKKESIDPTAKDNAGDLGFFSKGKMVPAFEQAAFALEIGELSEVVETPFGYHIIKVIEKKSAQEPNLGLVREEIKETIAQQKAWTIESALLQNLRKEAKIEIISPELRD